MNKIILYSLSTCIWCKKTKAHLEAKKIDFTNISMDLLEGADKEAALAELLKVNPRKSFPTLVFPDQSVVIGFKPEQIDEQLKRHA